MLVATRWSHHHGKRQSHLRWWNDDQLDLPVERVVIRSVTSCGAYWAGSSRDSSVVQRFVVGFQSHAPTPGEPRPSATHR